MTQAITSWFISCAIKVKLIVKNTKWNETLDVSTNVWWFQSACHQLIRILIIFLNVAYVRKGLVQTPSSNPDQFYLSAEAAMKKVKDRFKSSLARVHEL